MRCRFRAAEILCGPFPACETPLGRTCPEESTLDDINRQPEKVFGPFTSRKSVTWSLRRCQRFSVDQIVQRQQRNLRKEQRGQCACILTLGHPACSTQVPAKKNTAETRDSKKLAGASFVSLNAFKPNALHCPPAPSTCAMCRYG